MASSMASSQDTEITLGTGKLLVLFFGLVGVCALFFALGYSLGRKAEPMIPTTSAAVAPQTAPGTGKASSGAPAAPAMTFYKSVEQKDANPELTPAADAKTDTSGLLLRMQMRLRRRRPPPTLLIPLPRCRRPAISCRWLR